MSKRVPKKPAGRGQWFPDLRTVKTRSVYFQARPDSFMLDFPDYDFLLMCVSGREFWLRREVVSKDAKLGPWLCELVGMLA